MERADALGALGPAAQAPAYARLDDPALVEAVARGEAAALEALYERHGRSVYALALHLLSDRGAAEDVTQDVFVKLWRQPAAYQPGRGKLQPWLLGVAHHQAVDLLRRRQLEQRHRAPMLAAGADAADDGLDLLLSGLETSEGDPQSSLGLAEQRRVVRRALADLPAEQRVPIELAYYRGLTQAEIAETLRQPLGTVKTRMRLALQRLRAVPSLVDVWSTR